MTIGADQRVAILGPGAVGGYMAAAAKQQGLDPICVGRESTVELIKQEGIIIESEILGTLNQMPHAVSKLTEPVDWLIITPKSHHLIEALKRIDPASITSGTKILPLLNGIEHFEVIRSIFPKAKLIAGIIRIESKYVDANHFVQTSAFSKLEWGADNEELAKELPGLVPFIEQFGFTHVLQKQSSQSVLYGKLVTLNALALLSTTYNEPIGLTRKNPVAYQQLLDCIAEGLAVAQADGVTDLTFEGLVKFVDNLPDTIGTSMQRDFYAGKPIEVDAIAGALVRRGNMLDVYTPIINQLMKAIVERYECQV